MRDSATLKTLTAGTPIAGLWTPALATDVVAAALPPLSGASATQGEDHRRDGICILIGREGLRGASRLGGDPPH